MDEERVKQLEAARDYAWGALKDRYNEYPKRVGELLERIDLWLDGEEIVFIEFGFDVGQQYGTAYEAATLWAVVLTDRFVVSSVINKVPGSLNLDHPSWEMVLRDDITELDFAYDRSPGVNPRLSLTAKFAGISRDVKLPERERWDWPDDQRQALFISLREDLFKRP